MRKFFHSKKATTQWKVIEISFGVSLDVCRFVLQGRWRLPVLWTPTTLTRTRVENWKLLKRYLLQSRTHNHTSLPLVEDSGFNWLCWVVALVGARLFNGHR